METILQNVWTRGKWLFKGGVIAVLALLLQIPVLYVNDLVREREARQQEAIAEVSSKWAGQQAIAGPVLIVPYWQDEVDSTLHHRTRHLAYFLPDSLNIHSILVPEERHRGLYHVQLYSAQLQLS